MQEIKKSKDTSKAQKKKIKLSKPTKLKIPTEVKASYTIGAIGDTVPIKATLKIKANGNPVSNQVLKFHVAGKYINRTKTDNNGKAKVMYKVPNVFGTKKILVKFAGNDKFIKSSDTANFDSIKSSTKFSMKFSHP